MNRIYFQTEETAKAFAQSLKNAGFQFTTAYPYTSRRGIRGWALSVGPKEEVLP